MFILGLILGWMSFIAKRQSKQRIILQSDRLELLLDNAQTIYIKDIQHVLHERHYIRRSATRKSRLVFTLHSAAEFRFPNHVLNVQLVPLLERCYQIKAEEKLIG